MPDAKFLEEFGHIDAVKKKVCTICKTALHSKRAMTHHMISCHKDLKEDPNNEVPKPRVEIDSVPPKAPDGLQKCIGMCMTYWYE